MVVKIEVPKEARTNKQPGRGMIRMGLSPEGVFCVRGVTEPGGGRFIELNLAALSKEPVWYRLEAPFGNEKDLLTGLLNLQRAFRIGVGEALQMWGEVLAEEPDAHFLAEKDEEEESGERSTNEGGAGESGSGPT